MSISVISNNDISTIEKMIINVFGKIESKKCDLKQINDFPKYSIKNKEFKLEPVNNNEDLTIIYFFDIDYLINYNFDKSIFIISDIINDSNEGGFYNKLKTIGLIHSLNIYMNDEGVMMIFMEVNKDYGNITDTITKINYYTKLFLNNLKNLNLEKLYDYHINKYNINYKYDDKSDATEMVQDVCVNMLYYDIKNFYNGDKIVLKKDMNKFKDVIDKLNFSNANILYYGKQDLGKYDKLEDRYYKAIYGKLDTTYIKDLNLNEIKFKVVDYNKYYDIKPKIIKNLDRYNIPSLYDKRKWYGAVSKFNEVSVFGYLIFTNKSLFNTIDNFIITNISIKIINYYIGLKFSDASDIGFTSYFSSNSNRSNIVLNINGLNDKFTEYYNEVIKYIPTIEPKNDIINNYIINTRDNYENLKTLDPWKYFSIILKKMLNKNYYDFNDILKNLKNKDYIREIKKRIKTIINFKNLSLYSIFYGNLDKKDLPKNKIFKNNYNLEKIKYVNDKKITSGEFKKLNKNDKNNMVVYSYHCCNFNPLTLVKLFIVDNIMENEAILFENKRTIRIYG